MYLCHRLLVLQPTLTAAFSSLSWPTYLSSQAEREVADGDGVTVLNNQITCRIL